MQSLTMKDAHATACDFCSVDPADLLAAAEEFMTTPEARLEMATADFAAALTLTHNATSLILPGGANITTAAGDTAIAISLGSGNWVVVNYMPAGGYARAGAATASGLTLATARVLGRRSAGTGAIEDIPVGNDATGLSLAINRGTEQATTSGTAIDFTGIPAGVRRITIMLDGVSLAAGDTINLQLGDSGGIETTGYSGNSGIVAGTATGSIGASLSTAFSLIFSGLAASDTVSGVIELFNQSGNKWAIKSKLGRTGTPQIHEAVGFKTLSDVLDRVRIRSDAATAFDAGTINIMWEF